MDRDEASLKFISVGALAAFLLALQSACLIVPSHADTTAFFVVPRIYKNLTVTGPLLDMPAIRDTYPMYSEKWLWIHGDTSALCKVFAPDTIIAEMELLGWQRLLESEVIRDEIRLSGNLYYITGN